MDRKDTGETRAALQRALASGYRASRIVGTAHRRTSEETPLEVYNTLDDSRSLLEEALFGVETAGGVRGSIEGSLACCRQFVRELEELLSVRGLDRLTAGTLNSSLECAREAVENLSDIVDGYRSMGTDDDGEK